MTGTVSVRGLRITATALAVAFFTIALLNTTPAHAEGTFISAPGRTDIAYDDTRHILYITATDRVLRYDVAADAFLSPFVLGTELRGIDISPDGSTLAVADLACTGDVWGLPVQGNTWVWLVDLDTGAPRKALFTRQYGENGTWQVAYGADGSLLVTAQISGSGWLPIRRLDPGTGAVTDLASITDGSAIKASPNRAVIAIALVSISSGPVGRYRVSDGSLLWDDPGTDSFNYEAAARADAGQYAFVAGTTAFLYNGSMLPTGTLANASGALYSHLGNDLYVPRTGTSTIAVYDSTTLVQTGSYNFETTFPASEDSYRFKACRMVLSADDSALFATVPSGVRFVRRSPVVRGRTTSSFHGVPVSGALVEIWRPTGEGTWLLESTVTATAAGTWQYATTDDRPVRVRVSDPTGAHDPVWFGGTDVATADDVVPSPQPAVVNTTHQLVAGSTIRGALTSGRDGTPLAGASVTLYDATNGDATLETTVTASDGTFEFGGLAPAGYHLRFADPLGDHTAEYYEDRASLAAATLIEVGASAVATCDASLAFVPYRITGTVRSSFANRTVAGAQVEIWHDVGGGVWERESTLTANASGAWTFSGDYDDPRRVRVIDPSGEHAPAWFGGTDVTTATSIVPLRASPPAANVTLTLARPNTLSGMVRSARGNAPIGGVRVDLYLEGHAGLLQTTFTTSDGGYQFAGLGDGRYRVGFSDPGGNHATEYYDNQTTLADATWIQLTGGASQSTSVTLEMLPYFAGTVYDAATGAPIAGVSVRVYDATTVWSGGPVVPVKTTVTASDGSWILTGLTGAYHVIAFCDTTGRYRDVTFPESGLPVTDAYAFNPATWHEPTDAHLVPTSRLRDRVRRISGSDRYQTALAISRANFHAADAAIIASGESFADALSASPLAGALGGPVLLTPKGTVPPGLTTELKRLGVSDIVIVGGEGSISSAVSSAITAAGLPTPRRIAGANRYATSAMIALEVMRVTGRESDWPFLARGDVFADALSVGPFAYREARPILLTRPDALPAEVAEAWSEIADGWENGVIIVGGPNSISENVVTTLSNTWRGGGGCEFLRVWGYDRYETCEALVRAYGPARYEFVAVASGQAFPDALAGGAAAGYWGGPLLLTPSTGLGSNARGILEETGPYVLIAEAFGGERALNPTVLNATRDSIGTVLYDIDDPDGLIGVAAATLSDRTAATIGALGFADDAPMLLPPRVRERSSGTRETPFGPAGDTR